MKREAKMQQSHAMQRVKEAMANTKTINGQVFSRVGFERSYDNANMVATKHRDAGKIVRVTRKLDRGFPIYTIWARERGEA